jgi:anti-anti-sigma factor
MKITEQKMGSILLMIAEGRIDTNTSQDAETQVIQAIDGGVTQLIVDLAGVDYVSSAGLRVFLLAAKRLKKAGGTIILSGMKPHIKEIFDMAGFSALFTLKATKEEAVGALSR